MARAAPCRGEGYGFKSRTDRNMTNGHTKIPGLVEAVDGSQWWARLIIDGKEYSAEMIEPLPKGMGPGNLFTIHRTRRGKTYLYWITEPRITKRQIKKANQWARNMARMLQEAKG